MTPSDGLFMTIYTKLTLSRDVYERFPADFRPFSGNFPFSLSSCTKGSMLFFVVSKKNPRNLFCSRLAKLEGSLLVASILGNVYSAMFKRSNFRIIPIIPK